jgi:hypothetical protein
MLQRRLLLHTELQQGAEVAWGAGQLPKAGSRRRRRPRATRAAGALLAAPNRVLTVALTPRPHSSTSSYPSAVVG